METTINVMAKSRPTMTGPMTYNWMRCDDMIFSSSCGVEEENDAGSTKGP
jgi:hypothetical protein